MADDSQTNGYFQFICICYLHLNQDIIIKWQSIPYVCCTMVYVYNCLATKWNYLSSATMVCNVMWVNVNNRHLLLVYLSSMCTSLLSSILVWILQQQYCDRWCRCAMFCAPFVHLRHRDCIHWVVNFVSTLPLIRYRLDLPSRSRGNILG